MGDQECTGWRQKMTFTESGYDAEGYEADDQPEKQQARKMQRKQEW